MAHYMYFLAMGLPSRRLSIRPRSHHHQIAQIQPILLIPQNSDGHVAFKRVQNNAKVLVQITQPMCRPIVFKTNKHNVGFKSAIAGDLIFWHKCRRSVLVKGIEYRREHLDRLRRSGRPWRSYLEASFWFFRLRILPWLKCRFLLGSLQKITLLTLRSCLKNSKNLKELLKWPMASDFE